MNSQKKKSSNDEVRERLSEMGFFPFEEYSREVEDHQRLEIWAHTETGMEVSLLTIGEDDEDCHFWTLFLQASIDDSEEGSWRNLEKATDRAVAACREAEDKQR